MKNVLLDTNAYSHFVVGRSWVKIIYQAPRVFLPLPVLGELRFGFANGNKSEANESRLDDFLDEPLVDIVCPDDMTSRHYARIALQLRQKGIEIPQNDIWIAALAIQHNLWLCTSDAHFDHIPQLLRAVP
jgi:predicted nucleic acid-binding protein